MPICDHLRPLHRLIEQADELRSRQRGIEARMVLPEVSDADDPCPKRLHRTHREC
jgi:hypothetical protein